QVFVRDQRNGNDANRSRAFTPKTTPGDFTRQSELIKPFPFVTANTRGHDMSFPGSSWHFKTREWLGHFQDSERSFELALVVNVLPAGEKAQEIRCRHRLNFATQAFERI